MLFAQQSPFPIPTWIRQTITKAEKVKDDRVAFAATIEIFQAQGRVANSEVSYTIFESSSLKPKEEKLANRAADALFGSLGGIRDDVRADQIAQIAGA